MIRIITDSTSDINHEKAAELGIIIVPLTVHFGSQSYRDGIDITKDEFYKKLAVAETLPNTSQVNPDVFAKLFQRYIDEGDEIVGVFISTDMSGTCQSAFIAREMVSQEKIHIVDSRSTTFGMAILIHVAVQMRDQGKNAAQIAETLTGLTKRLRLLAVVDTLKYLKMGGRISSATAFVGGILGINPLIAIKDGKVESIGRARGKKSGMDQILEKIRIEPIDTAYPASFGHSNTPEDLRECISFFTRNLNIPQYFTGDIGITVGTHIGPGAVGISYIAKE